MFKFKPLIGGFSLGLGLVIGFAAMATLDSATLAFVPANPQAIATITARADQPSTAIAQTPSPSIPANPASPNNPLINKGPDHIIYIGLFLLLVTIINVVGLFSKKVKSALIFSSLLSLILIALLLFF